MEWEEDRKVDRVPTHSNVNAVAGVASVFQEGSRKGKFLKLQLRKTVVDVNSGYQGVRVE